MIDTQSLLITILVCLKHNLFIFTKKKKLLNHFTEMKYKILLLCLLSKLCLAQSLDSTFGINGIVTSQFSNAPTNEIITTAVRQPDGKIVMVGLQTASNKVNAIVIRTNPDGTLDNSFNTIGHRYMGGLGFEAVALQSDGKILVAGQDKAYRLNDDGSIDYSFGTDGFVQLNFGFTKPMTIKSIATVNDKIIFGGYARGTSGEYKFAVIQLQSDGSYDTSFDIDGKGLYFDSSASSDIAYALKIQADNKIVLTGQTIDGVTTDDNFLTIRINTDGSLDTSFGAAGRAMTSFASGNDYGRNIDIQSDGKILVIGANNNRYAIARYTIDGTLDTSFDGDGKLYLTNNLALFISSTQVIYDRPNIKSLNSGKILLSGSSNYNFNLIQLNENGSFDTSFGNNGVVYYSVNTRNRSSYMFIKEDNKIITGGSSHSNTGSNISKTTQLQFSQTGQFESSINFNTQFGISRINSVVEQSTGKIIAFCENQTPTSDDVLFARYNSDGSIDSSFGTNGTITLFTGVPNKMIQLSNGKLATCYLNSPFINMYNSNGTLDTTYGNNGTVNIDVLNSFTSNVNTIKSSLDGTIFVACSTNSANFGILKVLPNGTTDTSFGTNGLALIDFNYFSTTDLEIARDIQILSNGKIIVTGFLRFSSQIIATAVVCLLPNGTIDTSFGTNGKIITQYGNYTTPADVIKFEDDTFMINYFSSDDDQYIFTKYLPNGTVDPNFSSDTAPSLNAIYSLIPLPNGKFLGGGKSKFYDNGEFFLIRYNADGTQDTTFGDNGEFTFPILNGATGTDLIPLSDGTFLLGGYANNATHIVCAMAKISEETLNVPSFVNTKNNAIVYPNPVDDEAVLDYEVAFDSTVSIDLLDLNGKIIQNIINNRFQNKGEHQQFIRFNHGIEAGEYIVRLSSGKMIQSFKIIKRN